MNDGQLIIGGFNLFHVLTYIIPGLVAVFVINLYTEVESFLPVIDNDYIRLLMIIILSYIVGHVMHFPSIYAGKIVDRIIRVRLLDEKRQSKHGFSDSFKTELLALLKKKWGEIDNHSYYHLCEVLVENNCPNVWRVHHRWYSVSNFLRALIIPFLIIGYVVMSYSIPGLIICIFSAIVIAHRYRITKLMSQKQIYLGFYVTCREGK